MLSSGSMVSETDKVHFFGSVCEKNQQTKDFKEFEVIGGGLVQHVLISLSDISVVET